MMRLSLLAAALLGSAAALRAPPVSRGARATAALQAVTAQDAEALAARLRDAESVNALFVEGGEPRRFLRREKFVQAVVAAPGSPGSGSSPPSDDAALELWYHLGGAPPPPPPKKAEGGFFGSFAASLKENALGTKDTRPKDKWGDTAAQMTVIDPSVILDSDIAKGGFSADAFIKALVKEE